MKISQSDIEKDNATVLFWTEGNSLYSISYIFSYTFEKYNKLSCGSYEFISRQGIPSEVAEHLIRTSRGDKIQTCSHDRSEQKVVVRKTSKKHFAIGMIAAKNIHN